MVFLFTLTTLNYLSAGVGFCFGFVSRRKFFKGFLKNYFVSSKNFSTKNYAKNMNFNSNLYRRNNRLFECLFAIRNFSEIRPVHQKNSSYSFNEIFLVSIFFCTPMHSKIWWVALLLKRELHRRSSVESSVVQFMTNSHQCF